jgi:MFS family permease
MLDVHGRGLDVDPSTIEYSDRGAQLNSFFKCQGSADDAALATLEYAAMSAPHSQTTGGAPGGAGTFAHPLFVAAVGAWPLLFGMGLMMLGNGLQGSLLGLRATQEGFATAVTGLILSGYFLGFLAGSTLAPPLVARVGHIRVFAALASLASVAIVVHVLFIEPFLWGAMRVVTGFCYAGLYVVAESWLNDRSTNTTRGGLLSVYMVIVLGAMAGGQLLLNLADPGGFELFILVSILTSCALIPILLTATPAPSCEAPTPVGLRQLYRISPLGLIGCAGVGLANGAFVAMGSVYGQESGLTVTQISYLMGLAFVGGVIFQWPIGRLSDRFDRRKVLTGVTFIGALTALLVIAISNHSYLGLLATIVVFGGMHFPLYSLSLAHTNDFLEPHQMVAASSGLVLTTGAGATLGPVLAASAMAWLGPDGLFWFLTGVHGVIGVFALYRMTRRTARPPEDQTAYVALPRTSTIAAALAAEDRGAGVATSLPLGDAYGDGS